MYHHQHCYCHYKHYCIIITSIVIIKENEKKIVIMNLLASFIHTVPVIVERVYS